jgi:cellulose synthase/poly-beta-1,6-N-acetylglucosamine synthase-like glycosyltransferase
LAVVIPAHNEAGLIARCVESIVASEVTSGPRQIVVIADNCTDETAALAAAAGARVLVRQDPERRGKGHALRFAFNQLQAEGFNAFLVIDADSLVTPNLVRVVVQRLDSGASGVQCRYQVANESSSLRTRLMAVAFLAFNVLRPRGRAGWGISAGILGNGFALRGEMLQKVPYNSASIVEDLEYHLQLVAASESLEFIDEATVFGEVPAGGDAARVQRSRWEGGRLRMAREWVPRLVARIAHGESRLLEPLLDLVTLPLAYQVLLLTFLLFLPVPLRGYAAVALGIIVLHMVYASLLGERPLKTLLTLTAAPFYVAWKLTTLNSVFSASCRRASWVRTGRDGEAALRIAK